MARRRPRVPRVDAPELPAGCFSCDQQRAVDPPPRDDVLHTDHWWVSHAFNSTLPGWLVVLPTRHVTTFTQLHLHLVPRMPDQPEGARGPQVFTYLVDDSAQWIPEAERDRIALALRSALS